MTCSNRQRSGSYHQLGEAPHRVEGAVAEQVAATTIALRLSLPDCYDGWGLYHYPGYCKGNSQWESVHSLQRQSDARESDHKARTCSPTTKQSTALEESHCIGRNQEDIWLTYLNHIKYDMRHECDKGTRVDHSAIRPEARIPSGGIPGEKLTKERNEVQS